MAGLKAEIRRRYSPSEIRKKLGEADDALATGRSVSSICHSLRITRQTYYRWRRGVDSLIPVPADAGHVFGNSRHLNGHDRRNTHAATDTTAHFDRLQLLEAENQRLRDAVIALMLEKMTPAKR